MSTVERKKTRPNELLCVPVSDMRVVLDTWKDVVEKFNKTDLNGDDIKKMDDALANIIQFTKRPNKPLKF